MKLFTKNCFLALLCLYQSHPSNRHHPKTPFRGQGAELPFRGQGAEYPSRGQGVKTSTLQGVKAIAYIGSRYPCLLAKLLKISHLMIIVRQTFQFPFPPSQTSHRQETKSHSSTRPSWLPDTRDRTLVLDSWFLVKSPLSVLASCLSLLVSYFSCLTSHISNLFSRFSLLASRLSHLGSRLSLLASITLFLSPKVALTQDRGAELPQSAPIYLFGQINALELKDTLDVYVYPQFLGKGTHLPEPQHKKIPLIQGDGAFGLPGTGVFQFTSEPISEFAYILMVGKTSGTLMDYYLALPGDTLGVILDRITNKRSFVGPSAASYILQQQLKDLRTGRTFETPAFITVADRSQFLSQLTPYDSIPYGIKSFNPISKGVEEHNSTMERIPKNEGVDFLSLSLIELQRGRLPDNLLDALIAELWAWDHAPAVQVFNLALSEPQQEWTQVYETLKSQSPGNVSVSAALMAPSYTDYLLEKAIAMARMEKLKTWDILNETPDPILRERLAAKFIIKYFPRIADREIYMDQAIASGTDSLSLALLTKYRSHLSIGKLVSDAPLTDRDGNQVSLTALKGKAVFIDFWFTGCHACLTYYSAVLKPLKDKLADRDDIVFISISSDKKIAQWEKSLDGGRYTDTRAINLHTSGLSIQHPFLKAYNIHAFPSQLLLDKNGRIVQISEMRTYQEAMEKINQIINQ